MFQPHIPIYSVNIFIYTDLLNISIVLYVFRRLSFRKKSHTLCIQAVLKIGNEIVRHTTLKYHDLGLCVEPFVVLTVM
jgi:hypothetical protein